MCTGLRHPQLLLNIYHAPTGGRQRRRRRLWRRRLLRRWRQLLRLRKRLLLLLLQLLQLRLRRLLRLRWLSGRQWVEASVRCHSGGACLRVDGQ